MRVLVVNAGSSSLKLSVLDGDRLCGARELPAPGAAIDPEQVAAAVDELGPVDAVGHRIVHGGERYVEAVRISADVLSGLRELVDLAPLHQAKSLAALEAVLSARPGCPAVACFDTAFHATISPGAATYALPRSWRERWGLRRFGFHGLSHAYAARRAAELLGRSLDGLRIVTCHLGAGASLAAVKSGRSVDTTMGFTPLEGLAMATRSGSVDPGLLLWLLERAELSVQQMAYALEHESGMLALAGSADMRVVIEAATADDAYAGLALEVYLHRLRAGIGAMAAAMNGLDVIVWTGGVGEHSPVIRAAAADGLGFLGLRIDHEANRTAGADRDVTADGASARALVITAREDLEIVRQVRVVLG
ncbi:MAG: acetate/propionate family kinase [Solirubrobacterales bacterium]|nr:MAG: acetate/propionate family kinase [Solirubrobacterales bacterium]